MEVTLSVGAPQQVDTDLLAIGVRTVEGKPPRLPATLRALDTEWGGAISALVSSGDFAGKPGQSASVYPVSGDAPARVVLVGLGDEALSADALRSLAGRAVRRGMSSASKRVTLWIPAQAKPKDGARAGGQAIAEGAVLAGYRFDQYREKRDDDPKGDVSRFDVRFEKLSDARGARAGLKDGIALGESQNLARDLSNEPANHVYPVSLAQRAQKMAKEVGLKCTVLDVPAMKKLGMGGILGVGQGSEQPPRMVILEHNAPKRGQRAKPTLCVVGKGVTFDTGGISIKPSAGMHEMKHDMSGAAAVVGTMRAVALLNLPLHVVGIVGAAENMPDGNAYRPGDVLKTMSGKTIEVLNTDAEGRVVLSDALHYAVTKYEPRAMVDLATLTGACIVALGPWDTGLFTEDDALAADLSRAGEEVSEPVWRMPLGPNQKKAVRSRVADVANAAGRDGGASTAAAFLSAFTGDVPWAHLDIAGTANTTKSSATQPYGATGVGVRLVVQWLRNWKATPAKTSRGRSKARRRRG